MRRTDQSSTLKTRWGDTHNREGDVVEIDLVAHDPFITAETAYRIAMAEYSDRRGTRIIIRVDDRAANQRGNSERRIVIAGNNLAADDLGLSACVQIQVHRSKSEDIRECAPFLAQSRESLEGKGRPVGEACCRITLITSVITAWTEPLSIPGCSEQDEVIGIVNLEVF